MPKVRTQPIVAADSKTFFAGGPTTEPPLTASEPPTLAVNDPNAGEEIADASSALAPLPPQAGATDRETPPPVPPPEPDPFTLLWSRHVDSKGGAPASNRSLRVMELPGGCIIKSSWSLDGGAIAEAMCFAPGVVLRGGKLATSASNV